MLGDFSCPVSESASVLRGLSLLDRRTWLALGAASWFQGWELTWNVRLGEGRLLHGLGLPRAVFPIVANHQRRIDLVARRGEIVLLVEIKPWADPHALGQVLLYRLLWRRENPTGVEPVGCVLAAGIDRDCWALYERFGVRWLGSAADLA